MRRSRRCSSTTPGQPAVPADSRYSCWRRAVLGCAVLACGLAAPLSAQRSASRVALVLDHDTPRSRPLAEAFQNELRGFFRPGEITLLPPAAGDGTAAGVQAALRRALADSSVRAVIALGPLGSHLLARSTDLPKPAIAAVVVDAAWQEIPQQDGVSGVRNLTYVDQSYPVDSTLADFHRLIPFRRLAVVLDRQLVEASPGIKAGAEDVVRAVGAEVVVVPAGASADSVLAKLPTGVDAVYLTPVTAMPMEELRRLIDGLNARRLPSLSYLADPDVAAGALASYEPPEHWRQRARRVAVDLQRILAGEDAGSLPVRLVSAPQLTLNLATARQIGFSPSYSLLTDAELVGTDSARPGRHGVAGGCDARRHDDQSRSQGRRLRGGVGRAGRAACPLQPAPQHREPVRRNGNPGRDCGVEPGPAARASSSRAGSASPCRFTRKRLGPATARSSGCSRAAKPVAEQTRLDVVLVRGPGVHQRAAGPHPGRRAAFEPLPQPHPTSRPPGCARAWGAPAGPTSTAGRARWPTRGAM